MNLAGFRNCLAECTVHSLSSCYKLLTALVLLNSVIRWCNTVVPKVGGSAPWERWETPGGQWSRSGRL